MEFNLELAINAWKGGLKIKEIPIELGPRKGQTKLRTLKDGWRSLRMMLLYCPDKVFIWPGLLLLASGTLLHIATLLGLIQFDERPASAVTGIFATIFSVIGFQTLTLGLYAKIHSWSHRFEKKDSWPQKFYRNFRLERGLIAGAIMVFASSLILIQQIIEWFVCGLQPLLHPEWVTFAATLIILGISTIFTSLYISTMSMDKKREGA